MIARDRHAELLSALALTATSLERFATEIRHLARTEVREVEEPFAHGMKGSSAMPHKRNPKVAERICGLARVVRAAVARRARERRRSGTSATSRSRRPSGSSSRTRSSRSTTCSTASSGSSTGLVVYPERMLREPRRLARARLLAPAAARARRVRAAARARPTASCSGRRWRPGTRSATSASLVEADPEIAARLDAAALDDVFDLEATVQHVDVVFDRLHTLDPKGAGQCLKPQATSRAARSARSTRSTTSACCSSRATGSRPSTSCCPTEIPDKGRVLTGLSGFWFAQTASIVPNHLLALGADGRSTECRRLEMLPIECVVRGYLAGSGWKDYRRDRRGLRPPAPAGLVESDRLPEPIFTPATKAQTGHDENIDRAAAVALVGEERFDEVERLTLELYRFVVRARARARDHPRRHEARVRRRRRRAARARRRGVHAGLVAVLARRRVRARRPAAVVRQAVRPRLLRVARLGQDATRARSFRPTSSRARAPATSRRSSG